MKMLYFWLFIVFLVLILILSFGNSATYAPVYIFFSITQTSVTWIMLLTAVLGFASGFFFTMYFTSKKEDVTDSML